MWPGGGERSWALGPNPGRTRDVLWLQYTMPPIILALDCVALLRGAPDSCPALGAGKLSLPCGVQTVQEHPELGGTRPSKVSVSHHAIVPRGVS